MKDDGVISAASCGLIPDLKKSTFIKEIKGDTAVVQFHSLEVAKDFVTGVDMRNDAILTDITVLVTVRVLPASEIKEKVDFYEQLAKGV